MPSLSIETGLKRNKMNINIPSCRYQYTGLLRAVGMAVQWYSKPTKVAAYSTVQWQRAHAQVLAEYVSTYALAHIQTFFHFPREHTSSRDKDTPRTLCAWRYGDEWNSYVYNRRLVLLELPLRRTQTLLKYVTLQYCGREPRMLCILLWESKNLSF